MDSPFTIPDLVRVIASLLDSYSTMAFSKVCRGTQILRAQFRPHDLLRKAISTGEHSKLYMRFHETLLEFHVSPLPYYESYLEAFVKIKTTPYVAMDPLLEGCLIVSHRGKRCRIGINANESRRTKLLFAEKVWIESKFHKLKYISDVAPFYG